MNKRILAAVICAASVLSLAGCGEKGTSSDAGNSGTNSGSNSGTNSGDTNSGDTNSGGDTTDPTEGLTDENEVLTIGTWTSNGDIANLIKVFTEVTGTSVKVEQVGAGEKGENARDQYKDIINDASIDCDIIICDVDWVRNYLDDDTWCLPLSDIGIDKSEYTDAYNYTLAVGTGSDGVFRGATFQATPGCFFYNAGLAEEYLGVTSADDMQAKVKDWDTFMATAKELNEKSGGKVALQATEGGLWQVYQCYRTKPWVVDGKLEMDNAADFYDFAKELKDNGGISDAIQWDEASWYPTMQAGDALGEFAPTWGLTGLGGSILGDCAGDFKGDDAIFTAIAGPADWYWGGSYFGVTKKCNTKKTAAQFIRFYTLNWMNGMEEYAKKTGDFMNNKTVNASVTYENPALIGGQNHKPVIADIAEKIDMDGKITIYDSIIKSNFNNSVQDYLDGKVATKEAAIEQFKNAVRKDLPDITVE